MKGSRVGVGGRGLGMGSGVKGSRGSRSQGLGLEMHFCIPLHTLMYFDWLMVPTSLYLAKF